MSRLRAMMENPEPQERATSAFCSTCGSRNIAACESCRTPIDHRFPGQSHSYCAGCGKPFPWTEAALKAAKEYADELEELNNEEKAALKSTFDDLTADTPRTELAAHRLKNFLRKIGPTAGDVLSKIMVNVITDAAKKKLGM